MKMSHAWIRELCPHDIDAPALADKLTAAGLEVENLTAAAPPLDGVVVARIIDAQQHPNADRLRICQVDAGNGDLLQIVCGAPNARPGLTTALATIGTRLPGDLVIRKGKLRGEVSMGMLCAAAELGLDGGDGIIELDDNLIPGTPVATALNLDDTIFDIGLTPNRGDCLSALGIARELQALGLGTLGSLSEGAESPSSATERPVSVENAQDCPRYTGRVITGLDGTRPTPLWMRERLRRCGLRSRGPLVDVTNYVMLELGQPLHAFDNQTLDRSLVVRRAKPGEELTLLDSRTIALDSVDLIIADARGPQALAGAMGGLASAVSDATHSIFLESAHFAPAAVAGVGRRHKIVSDALHRYERATDPALPLRSLERATQLLLSICGGQAGPVQDSGAPRTASTTIELDLARTRAILGAAITVDDARRVFSALGFDVRVNAEDQLQATPPSWRHDIAIAEDLMEELARIIGYDTLGGEPQPLRPRFLAPDVMQDGKRRLREALASRGWSEVVSFSFTSAVLADAFSPEDTGTTLSLANPISELLTTMRPSLWASLLPLYVHNQRQQQRDIRLFEVGRTFRRDDSGAIRETECLAGIAGGHGRPENWNTDRTSIDFYDLSGLLVDLLQRSQPGATLHCVPSPHPSLHPGISARVMIGDTPAGWIGQLHPRLWQQHGEGGKPPYVFECSADAFGRIGQPAIAALPSYPSSRRDLSFIVKSEACANDLARYMRLHSPLPLVELRIFDVFAGGTLQDGFKSIAFGLIFQDFSRTLEDGEIDAAVAALVDGLGDTFQARLRD